MFCGAMYQKLTQVHQQPIHMLDNAGIPVLDAGIVVFVALTVKMELRMMA